MSIKTNESDIKHGITAFIKYFIPWKKDSLSEIMRKLIFISSIVIFIHSIGELNEYTAELRAEEQTAAQIQMLEPDFDSETQTQVAVSEPDEAEVIVEEKIEEEPKPQKRTVNKWAKELIERNKEVVGWIKIPGFCNSDGKEYINYPVLQHSDNDYYLSHDIDKNYYYSGSIFADYVIPIDKEGQPDNIILYGHHMRKLGTAFTHLAEYKEGVDMVKKYPIIEFNTIYEKNQEYIIVGCFAAAISKEQDNGKLFDYWNYRNFDDSDYTFKNWLKNVKKWSWYSCDIQCDPEDDYLTLSTCSNEVPDMRWVIIAKKLDEDDDKEAIINSYKERNDKDIYFPQVWKDYWGNHKKYLGWSY